MMKSAHVANAVAHTVPPSFEVTLASFFGKQSWSISPMIASLKRDAEYPALGSVTNAVEQLGTAAG
jgi:hypothetical protein